MLNKEQIKALIPHRDPFLLVDEVIELIPGEKAVGYKYVNEDEYYFEGHFPEKKVMPGVLIVEAIAQLGATIALSLDEFKDKLAFLVGIDNTKFRQMVIPGDKLKLTCELGRFRRGFGYGYGKAYVGDKLVCETKISFAIDV